MVISCQLVYLDCFGSNDNRCLRAIRELRGLGAIDFNFHYTKKVVYYSRQLYPTRSKQLHSQSFLVRCLLQLQSGVYRCSENVGQYCRRLMSRRPWHLPFPAALPTSQTSLWKSNYINRSHHHTV